MTSVVLQMTGQNHVGQCHAKYLCAGACKLAPPGCPSVLRKTVQDFPHAVILHPNDETALGYAKHEIICGSGRCGAFYTLTHVGASVPVSHAPLSHRVLTHLLNNYPSHHIPPSPPSIVFLLRTWTSRFCRDSLGLHRKACRGVMSCPVVEAGELAVRILGWS